jgi:hypothetical protein
MNRYYCPVCGFEYNMKITQKEFVEKMINHGFEYSERYDGIIIGWISYTGPAAYTAADEYARHEDEIIRNFSEAHCYENIRFGTGDGNGRAEGAAYPVFAYAEI